MRRASIDELRDHAAKLVSAANEGEVIVIERDGEPVADRHLLAAAPHFGLTGRSA